MLRKAPVQERIFDYQLSLVDQFIAAIKEIEKPVKPPYVTQLQTFGFVDC